MSKPSLVPTEIRYEKDLSELYLSFNDNKKYQFSAEFLRVFSPSAEVRGHGPNSSVLQVGKKNVKITAIEPVGNYAVKLVFDDGHDTGLYSWDWFNQIGEDKDKLWQSYLQQLEQSGGKRTASGID